MEKFYRDAHVLVTGGGGFIGSHVVELLVGLGAVVRVPIRNTTNIEFIRHIEPDIDIIEADLFDRLSVDRAMVGQDIVIHLAAAKGGGIAHSMRHHGSLFRNNMLSFIHVLDSARDQGIDRFLVVSSACVYPRDAIVPTPEEEGFRDAPEPTNAGYGWSKRMEEYMALAYADEYGMNIGIARPFNAYGPRDDFFRETNHVIPGLITRLFNGQNPLVIWGSGRQTRAFLYVDDFARGVLEVCARPEVKGPVNIGPAEEITIGRLAEIIVELSGLDVEIRFDLTKPDGQPRRACDTRKAKDLLGFQSMVPLRAGLARTIEWYRSELERRGQTQ